MTSRAAASTRIGLCRKCSKLVREIGKPIRSHVVRLQPTYQRRKEYRRSRPLRSKLSSSCQLASDAETHFRKSTRSCWFALPRSRPSVLRRSSRAQLLPDRPSEIQPFHRQAAETCLATIFRASAHHTGPLPPVGRQAARGLQPSAKLRSSLRFSLCQPLSASRFPRQLDSP